MWMMNRKAMRQTLMMALDETHRMRWKGEYEKFAYGRMGNKGTVVTALIDHR